MGSLIQNLNKIIVIKVARRFRIGIESMVKIRMVIYLLDSVIFEW